MDAEIPDKINAVVMDTTVKGSRASKKNEKKVPKRIHKAKREKMNREHMNELFLTLAEALQLTPMNSGKASILNETTRIVKDLLSQIECLRKENASLSSESEYVTVERNELEDEKFALEVQIGEVQNKLKERLAQPKLDLNVAPPECQQSELAPYLLEDSLRLPVVEPAQRQAPVLNPVFFLPLHSDLAAFPEPNNVQLPLQPISNVTKPCARYPTPADSWPSQVLHRTPELGKDFRRSGSYSNSCGFGGRYNRNV